MTPRPEVSFVPGDNVAYVVPTPAQGCVGRVVQSFYMTHRAEDIGYVLVEITTGNTTYPTGTYTTWYWAAIQKV